MKLYRLDGEEHDVINKADFFLNKRLSVADPGEEAVVPCRGEGPFADLFFGDEEASALGLRAVL